LGEYLEKGCFGPFRCQLCESQEETMDHLLNSCIFTSKLRDGIALIFRKTNRDRGSITNTLSNWWRNFSNNETINKAWALTPSFLIWNVWKECNNRIFKNKKNFLSEHHGIDLQKT